MRRNNRNDPYKGAMTLPTTYGTDTQRQTRNLLKPTIPTKNSHHRAPGVKHTAPTRKREISSDITTETDKTEYMTENARSLSQTVCETVPARE